MYVSFVGRGQTRVAEIDRVTFLSDLHQATQKNMYRLSEQLQVASKLQRPLVHTLLEPEDDATRIGPTPLSFYRYRIRLGCALSQSFSFVNLFREAYLSSPRKIFYVMANVQQLGQISPVS